MRLTPAQKVYREERDRAAKRRRALMAPIMRAAKKQLEEEIAACRPRKGRPRKKGDRNNFVIEKRDPLEIPGRFRTGGN